MRRSGSRRDARAVRDAARACPLGLVSVVTGTRSAVRRGASPGPGARPRAGSRSSAGRRGLSERGARSRPGRVRARRDAGRAGRVSRARGSTCPGRSSSWRRRRRESSRSGLVPVLAHPERCREVQSDPAVVVRLIEQGALLCLNGPSLVGEPRRAGAPHRLGAARGGPRAPGRVRRPSLRAPAHHGRGVGSGLRAAWRGRSPRRSSTARRCRG